MNFDLFRKTLVKILPLFVSFAVLAIFVPQIYAYDTPRIYIKQLNISKTSFNAGDTIDGNFLMWNSSPGIAAGLSYTISLDQGDVSFNKQSSSVTGSINSNETLSQSFSYVIPNNTADGDYKLKVQIFLQSGMALNWGGKDIKITGGAGSNLNISNSYVMHNKDAFAPAEGANFNVSDRLKIKFSAINNSLVNVNFKPDIKIYFFQANNQELDHIYGNDYTLKPKENKDIEINLPQYDKPGSYIAKVVLSNTNGSISNTQDFRWVIKGVGARVLDVKVDGDSLTAGKNMKVTVNFVGPADASDAGEATLSVAVYGSGNNQIIASGEKQVEIKGAINSETFDLVPNSDSSSFRVEAKIAKDGSQLDFYKADIVSSQKTGDQIAPTNKNKDLAVGSIVLLILLIAVVLLKLLFKKNRRIPPVAIILIGLTILGILGIGAFEFYGDKVDAVHTSYLAVTWNQPMKDTVYNSGDIVYYEGLAVQGTCLNDASLLQVDSFVCDVNKMNCIPGNSETKYSADTTKFAYNTDDGYFYVLDTEDGDAKIIRVNPTTKIQGPTYSGEGLNGDTIALGRGRMHMPRSIFYSSPYFYITDTGNNKVVKVATADLNNPDNWQLWSSADGINFNAPWGILFQSPYIYVADSGNNRVVRFNPNNGVSDGYTGAAVGGLSSPDGISTDGTYIYVADSGNNRVVRFKPDTSGGNTWQTFTTDGTYTISGNPRDVYYSAPYLYVADTMQARILRFNPNLAGAWESFGNGFGSDNSHFGNVGGIFYWNSHIYAGDGYNNKRIVRFDPSDMIGTWDVFDFSPATYEVNSTVPAAAASTAFAKGTNGGGTGAKLGAPVISGGAITSVSVTNGGIGYLSAPTVLIEGDGTGAAATAVISGGAVTAINITNGGSGYTSGNTAVYISPEGAVYAKIHVSVTYVDLAIDEQDSYERIIINNTATAGACGGVTSVTDNRDGTPRVYDTVEIGSQCWLKQNMNLGTMIPLCSGGSAGPCSSAGQTLNDQNNASGIEKWCYSNNSSNCDTSGGIYQWAEAMNLPTSCNTSDCSASITSPHQGICPPGWHIPTDAEEHTLELYLTDGGYTCDPNRTVPTWDDCYSAGSKLQQAGGFNGTLNGYTTSSSYTYPFDDSYFDVLNWVGGIWSSTQDSGDYNQAWHRHLFDLGSSSPSGYNVMRHQGPKTLGDGVRCILGGAAPTPSPSASPTPTPSPTPNTPPVVSNLTTNTGALDYCVKPLTDITLSWTFTDAEDGSIQTAYQIIVTRNDSVTYNTGKVTGVGGSATSVTGVKMNSVIPGFISFKHSYTWTVQVWDSGDQTDGPDAGPNFSTPDHKYPDVNFVCSPSDINCPSNHAAFEEIIFTDNSTCYDTNNNITACTSWTWDFCKGTTCSDKTDNGETVTHTYDSVAGTYLVDLLVSDGVYSCRVQPPKPINALKQRWKEIVPD